VFVVFVIACVVLVFSFGVIEPRQYGIRYHDWDLKIARGSETILGGGRHLIGPLQHFVHYPRGLVTFQWTSEMENSDGKLLSCWSKSGQIVEMSLSLQLNLNKERISDIYFAYGGDIYSMLRAQILAVVKNTATNYETITFFTERNRLKAGLQEAIVTEFAREGFVTLYDMQLRKVTIPEGLEEAILQKLLEKQRVFTAENNQEVQVNEKQREEIIQRAEATSLVTLQYEDAMGEFEVTRAASRGRRKLFNTKSGKFAAVLETIGYNLTTDGMDEKVSAALNFFVHQRMVTGNAAKRALEAVGLGRSGITI
jgi:hypothetical protein